MGNKSEKQKQKQKCGCSIKILRVYFNSQISGNRGLLVKCWKIVNVKDKVSHVRFNDPNRKPFYSLMMTASFFLQNFGMPGGRGSTKHKSLTSEPRSSVSFTLKAMIRFTKSLLDTTPLSPHMCA